ncbi:MAG: acetyl-CoA carboxylase biotin carboxylase subunit [Planctomycetes bacterium RBG_16_43_13]|nr:MAG: acetyl-CoA carboxylase biotin carboxylase subunit [Planctomycetes bacterium RBG_16_43_13]
MFSRVLIANRGEIALRVIRACKELGIETVVVYSEADKNAMYLKLADYSVCIGPAQAAKSYLDISRIISAAEITDVDAIHPGYGFLSENSHFAEVCRSCNIVFIGPNPEAQKAVGDKVNARELAKKVKIPLIPGSDTVLKDEKEALDVARRLGYPVMLKAAGGGGGRGMRIAHNDISLVNNFLSAQSEAGAAFKNSAIYLEKYINKARHIEIQILADRYGNIIHLGERDCTIQRRYQKLIEESPSPIMNSSLRKDMGNAAISFAKAAKYDNAGTVEFLVDERGKFYFIEMNARIQVEHPVTEMVTGVDLVKEQIRIAAGERLRYSQRDININGTAIECRINAEDPTDGFKPCPGKITSCYIPGGPGIRVDSHIYAGYEIPSFYDSLIGKLIVHRKTRGEALAAMKRALSEFVIEGVPTTIPLHLAIFDHTQYIKGQVDTTFIESYFSK